MPCISSTDLINQYGNICAPGDRACWESQGVGINAGPFDPAPGGGPPDSCCSPCANPCEAGQVRYYESVGNGTYENCIHGGTGHEICCECA